MTTLTLNKPWLRVRGQNRDASNHQLVAMHEMRIEAPSFSSALVSTQLMHIDTHDMS